jgi:hypothetical protein
MGRTSLSMKDKRLPLPRKIPRRLSKLLRRIGEAYVQARNRESSSNSPPRPTDVNRWTRTKLAEREIPFHRRDILLIKPNALT